MKILKPAEEGYVPTVEIWISTYDNPIIDVTLTLKQLPKDADFDALRHYLKLWAKMCGYGELKAAYEDPFMPSKEALDDLLKEVSQ